MLRIARMLAPDVHDQSEHLVKQCMLRVEQSKGQNRHGVDASLLPFVSIDGIAHGMDIMNKTDVPHALSPPSY